MAVYRLLLLVLSVAILQLANGSHFRGGIVSWRALNTTPSGSSATILIHQRYSWRRSAFSPVCASARVAAQALVGSGTGSLTCPTGSCSPYTSISADVYCTDFSVGTDFSSGERYDTRTLTLNRTYIVGFISNAWFALAIGGNGPWYVIGKIDLTVRPDGILNTSPVTSTLPIIYRQINTQHVHIVQMADADSTDTLRCRWATVSGNANGYNECGSVCAPSLPSGFTLFADNCTLVFRLAVADYYAVALQIEDFYTSSSSSPMSSVPIQFLFYGRAAPGGCSLAPTIIGVRPNLACLGTPIGVLTNETVIAQVNCVGKTIIDFTTSSPVGMTKSSILNPSTGIYIISLLWTPVQNQFGPQGFCAGAVDSTNVQSDPWCITFLVGFTAPNLQTPNLVQGSVSPVGTVLSNHSIFSIQSVNGVGVNRPGRNGTYVYFNDATLNNAVVLQYDCGWSPNVIYSGSTIIIYAPFAWQAGHTYFVTFDSGASSGTEFCRAESAPIMSSTFWVFDIWNPAVSSTTSAPTTPPTTHTVTTRPPSTTTPIANLTTTGIIVTTSSTLQTVTTATTTTTATTDTTTSVTTDTTTSTVAAIGTMTPQQFEEACKQPVIIGTVVSMVAMLPINAIGMFTIFTKLNKLFNPEHIKHIQRGAQLGKRH